MKKNTLLKTQYNDIADSEFYFEVISGLRRRQRAIPPKYFYDETGSILFDAICKTAEYYPARTETKILKSIATEIAGMVAPGAVVIEPGCGSAEKVRILLDQISPSAYVGMDISGEYLQGVINNLSRDYPDLTVKGICNDFALPEQIQDLPAGNRLIFFPGSTIGNFEPNDAVHFLKQMATLAQPGGGILIGIDMKKDKAILHAAYNDSEGRTAAFNMNLLKRMNLQLNADFQDTQFKHSAHYNDRLGRIEMHLVSLVDQVVEVSGSRFEFLKDDTIHTESSYKYTIKGFQALARLANLEPEQVWTDPDNLFSLHFLRNV